MSGKHKRVVVPVDQPGMSIHDFPEEAPPILFEFHWIGKAYGKNKKYKDGAFHLTPAYDNFLADIAETCWATNPGVKVKGFISLEVHMWIDPARDSDSLLPPLFDGIEQSAIINNDNQIRGYSVAVKDKEKGQPDEIMVMALPIAHRRSLSRALARLSRLLYVRLNHSSEEEG